MLKNIILSALFSLTSIYCAFAQNENYAVSSSGNIDLHIKGEYNRGNHNYGEVSLTGSINIYDLFNFKLGSAYGKSTGSNDINVFLKAGLTPFSISTTSPLFPLAFSVSYIYNGFLDFETHTQSIFPAISYDTERFGISIGVNFRYTSFFSEIQQFEPFPSLYIYYYFINNKDLIMGMGIGNFNDFHIRNLGAICINFNTVININKKWSIISDVELMQGGIMGLTTNFYGISIKGGARFSW